MGRRAKTADSSASGTKKSATNGSSRSKRSRRSRKSPSSGSSSPSKPKTAANKRRARSPTKHTAPRPATTGHDRSSANTSRSTRGGSDDMSGELTRIQVQTGVFHKKIAREKERVAKLEKQIATTRGQILGYRKDMGGETALTNNDRFVKHQVTIMEKRVKNAAVEYMRACENNRQLRMAVNDERRYRMIQLEVKKRIEGDLKKLQDGNIATASTIAATNRELKRVEEHVDAHKAWAAQQEAEEESKWRELDQDPADINLNALTETNSGKLPKVGGARAMPKGAKSGGLFAGESAEPSPRRGNMTVKEEKRMKHKVVSAKWESAFLTSEEAALAEKLDRYHETFAEVKKALGVADINEFNDTFSAREDQNFAIVQHINSLNEEAAQLEEQIDNVKRKAKNVVETCVTDNRPRKRISEQLEKKLHATVARYLWYEERLTDLTDVAQTFRRGIGNLYAFLHGINKSSNEDIPGLTELNMIKYLGSIESEVFKLLKRYLKQHAFPVAVRPQSRASARSTPEVRRAQSPDVIRTAGLTMPESPITGASAKLLQGPSESTGKLAKIHVVAPTVATVTALAANASVDEDSGFGDDTGLDGGQDALKPLSLDTLRRSAMVLQATGEMNLTRTAALDQTGAGSGSGSGKHKRRGGSPTAADRKVGQGLSATIPALHIGGARQSRRSREDGRGSRSRMNKTMA